MGRHANLANSRETSKLEESYNRTLAIRSVGVSPVFQPLAGFSASRLRAEVRPERYEAQINPFRHTLTISSNVVDSEMQVDRVQKRAVFTPGDFALIPRGTLTNGYCHGKSAIFLLPRETRAVILGNVSHQGACQNFGIECIGGTALVQFAD